MTKENIYQMLVDPVCALEEYVNMTNSSPIVNTVALALRHILNEIDADMSYRDKGNGG